MFYNIKHSNKMIKSVMYSLINKNSVGKLWYKKIKTFQDVLALENKHVISSLIIFQVVS